MGLVGVNAFHPLKLVTFGRGSENGPPRVEFLFHFQRGPEPGSSINGLV